MISPHVHVPFGKIDNYLSFIRDYKLNLEIYFSSEALDAVNISDIEALKGKLDHNPSISIHGPFMDLSPGAVDEKVRAVTMERYTRTLEISEPLSPKTVVFHSGYEKWKYGLKPEIWLEKSLITWRKMHELASKTGLKIAVENIFEDEPSTLRQLMELLKTENLDTIGICFDTGHLNLFSKKSASEWMSELLPYVVELHLHDNNGDFDAHKPIGEGKFDFKALFEALKGRNPVFTLEAHDPESVLKSMKRFSEYYQRYLA